MLKRISDIVLSGGGILVLSPLLLIIFIAVKASSPGPAIYRQKRVGRNSADFEVYKFRSMYTGSDRKGLLTVGDRDPRITGVGAILRKYKLDELPQLFNVIKGDMSIVGPRPEVRKYVELYDEDQRKVLEVRPGITDLASIKYRNENEILSGKPDPEDHYIRHIMPDKIRINLEYINDRSILKDIKVMVRTVAAIVNGSSGS
ncbi:MAG: sugar transferase [Ignavibacteria bacterium]|nr:sugar transferase [Ignavibacteria bacterium]